MPHFHWLRKQKKKVSLFIWILMSCLRKFFIHTIFTWIHSFLYARTGALLYANGISSRTFFLVFSMQEQVPMEYYYHEHFFINSKHDTTLIITWHDMIYWLRAILFFFTNNTIFSSWKNSKTKIYEYTQLAGKYAMAQLGLRW